MTKIFLAAVAALALTTSSFAQDKKADPESQKFIKAAIEGNYAEVDAGKLAQEKGKSPAVKEFGAMLAKDHGDANMNAQAAAKAINVDSPSGSSVMQKGTYAKLKLLQGDTFDRSFANTMVSDHEKDIDEYKKAAVKNDAAGQYAKQTLPKLQRHLEMANSLKAKVDAPTTGSGSAK